MATNELKWKFSQTPHYTLESSNIAKLNPSLYHFDDKKMKDMLSIGQKSLHAHEEQKEETWKKLIFLFRKQTVYDFQ